MKSSFRSAPLPWGLGLALSGHVWLVAVSWTGRGRAAVAPETWQAAPETRDRGQVLCVLVTAAYLQVLPVFPKKSAETFCHLTRFQRSPILLEGKPDVAIS